MEKSWSASRNRWASIMAAVLVAGLLVGGGYFYFFHNTAPARGPQGNPASLVRSALGRVEPEAGIVTVTIPLADQLKELPVKEGDDVAEDKELAKLAGYHDRELELALLDAQINEAQKKVDSIQASGLAQSKADEARHQQALKKEEDELEVQEQKVELLKKQRNFASDTLEQMRAGAFNQTGQEVKKQQLNKDQAELELKTAESLLRQLKEGKTTNEKVYASQKALAEAKLKMSLAEIPLESLKKQRDLTEHRMNQSVIRAPSAGTILDILARKGEIVGQSQPLLRMANTKKLVIVAEVFETDAKYIHEKQAVVITSRALDKDQEVGFAGRVKKVGQMVAKGRTRSADPMAEVDRQVVEVKISIDDDAPQPKELLDQLTQHWGAVDFKLVPVGELRKELERLINHQVTVYFLPEKKP